MPDPSQQMRFWGWGEDERAGHGLPAHARPFLDEQVGTASAPRPPVALEQVELPASAIGASTKAALESITGSGNVRDDRRERVLHAAGKGYPDLVRLRAGRTRSG